MNKRQRKKKILNSLNKEERYRRTHCPICDSKIGVFNEYFNSSDFIQAKEWAEKALHNDTAENGAYEYFQMGRVCYELNEIDEALKYFEIAYQRGKKRAFQEFDKKYWKFYSENKK